MMAVAWEDIVNDPPARLELLRNIPVFQEIASSNPCYSLTGRYITRWYSFIAELSDTSPENVHNQFEIHIMTGKLIFYGAYDPFIIELKCSTPFPEYPNGVLVIVQIGAETGY